MSSNSRSTIREDAAELIGGLAWSGTATGGSTSTLIHTGNGGLQDSGMSAYFFNGLYLLLDSGSDAGYWRQVREGTNGYVPSTGTLTVGSVFTTGAANGTTYEVLRFLNPDEWNECINDALGKLRYRYKSPITLVTDGDMEASGTSNWTGTNATVSKVTSGAFVDGTQCLQVSNTLANGYATSASITCSPGYSFHLWADYKSTSGTAQIQIRDVTNSANIDAVQKGIDVGVNADGGQIEWAFTAPTGCYAVSVRLIGVESNAVIQWDNCIIMRSGRQRYDAPSWVVDRDQFHTIQKRTGQRLTEYTWADLSGPINLSEEQTAVTAFRIELPSGIVAPLYVTGERPYTTYGSTTLSADTSTTNCPIEWAVYAVASEVLERYLPRTDNQSQQRLQNERARINTKLQELSHRLMPHAPQRDDPTTEWVYGGGSRYGVRRW